MLDVSTRLRSVPWNALSGCSGAVCAALDEVLAGRPADRVIDRVLRANRSWSPEQRTAAVEAIFGVSLWRRRLAYQLGGCDLRALGARPALFSLLRDLAGLAEDQAASLAGLLREGPPPQVREPPSGLADRCSLPDWLAEALERELGPEAGLLADALNLPGPICLRANLLRSSGDVAHRGWYFATVASALRICASQSGGTASTAV